MASAATVSAPAFPHKTYKSAVRTYHTDTYPAIDPTSPQLSTHGRNVIVAGGSYGIGLWICRSFVKSRASSISILGRKESALRETKTQLEIERPDGATTKIFTYVTDIVERDQVKSAFQAISLAIGTAHILVANAAYMNAFERVGDASPDDWFRCFEVSLKGNFNLIQAFLPIASKNASIIHISSCVVSMDPALMPKHGLSAYHPSKVAAVKFFECVHSEYPEMFVLNIHPGCHRTPNDAKVPVGTTGIGYDEWSLSGDAVVWAVSRQAAFLNGKFIWANWDVDELKAKEREIVESDDMLTLGVFGLRY